MPTTLASAARYQASTTRFSSEAESTGPSPIGRKGGYTAVADVILVLAEILLDRLAERFNLVAGVDGKSRRLRDRSAPLFGGSTFNLVVMSAPTREQAWELFCEWTESASLRRHVLGVEAAMRAYARKYGEDEELWAATAILHDLDYERYPDSASGHPRVALQLFEDKEYPRELIDAVAGHATYLGVARESRVAKALFAVDELTGFIAAVALVRPNGIAGMTPKSVKKKLKQPSFAAAVNREEIRQGAEALAEDFDDHIAFVIRALEPHAEALGLAGS